MLESAQFCCEAVQKPAVLERDFMACKGCSRDDNGSEGRKRQSVQHIAEPHRRYLMVPGPVFLVEECSPVSRDLKTAYELFGSRCVRRIYALEKLQVLLHPLGKDQVQIMEHLRDAESNHLVHAGRRLAPHCG